MNLNQNMNKTENEVPVFPPNQPPAGAYDDGNIPKEDLPQDVIPDEVPRKDGPGGE